MLGMIMCYSPPTPGCNCLVEQELRDANLSGIADHELSIASADEKRDRKKLAEEYFVMQHSLPGRWLSRRRRLTR